MKKIEIIPLAILLALCSYVLYVAGKVSAHPSVPVSVKGKSTINKIDSIKAERLIISDSISSIDARIDYLDKEIKHREEMNSIITKMIQDRKKINNQIKKINKDLREYLEVQRWIINPPSNNDTGTLSNITYSIVSMPITSGGSTIAIGPAALGKGVAIKDSFATTGSNNAWTGTLIIDTIQKK